MLSRMVEHGQRRHDDPTITLLFRVKAEILVLFGCTRISIQL